MPTADEHERDEREDREHRPEHAVRPAVLRQRLLHRLHVEHRLIGIASCTASRTAGISAAGSPWLRMQDGGAERRLHR